MCRPPKNFDSPARLALAPSSSSPSSRRPTTPTTMATTMKIDCNIRLLVSLSLSLSGPPARGSCKDQVDYCATGAPANVIIIIPPPSIMCYASPRGQFARFFNELGRWRQQAAAGGRPVGNRSLSGDLLPPASRRRSSSGLSSKWPPKRAAHLAREHLHWPTQGGRR